LIGSAAAGRELNCKIAYPVLRSIKILVAFKCVGTHVVSVGLVNKTQSILAKAFRGELVPQDPNDESASELLKRIQEERRKQEAEGRPDRRGAKRKGKR
jgi:hypothetical protein